MVEPAGVRPMTNRVAGKPKADHLVDRFAVVGLSDVGQPGGEIGGGLPPNRF